MYDYFNKKCKDLNPLKTIKRIKDILADLGIMTGEYWTSQYDRLYSVSICVFGTTLTADGKGISAELALASGYGELIERLQNFHFDGMKMDTGGEARLYGGFCFAPDEKRLSMDEILDCEDSWAKVFTLNAKLREEKADILNEWVNSVDSYDAVYPDFFSLPFINIRSGRIQYLPKVMLHVLYGSNGMCAGNTPEEALVHGFSEVMERYAHIAVANRGIIPPTIPDSYIEQYPAIYQFIKGIERMGRYKIVVKDCSLGEGLPVVAVVFIDVDKHAYTVSFGSHPVFEIAIEKCLTEMWQGGDIKITDRMNKFSWGCYDKSLFSSNFSYSFKGYNGTSIFDNKYMLNFICNILEKKGCDILVRDVSFLGFPSYQVIVPDFSGIPDLSIKAIRANALLMRVRRISRNLGDCTSEELQELAGYMLAEDNKAFAHRDSLAKVQDLPLKSTAPCFTLGKELFAAVSYYKSGQFGRACEMMDKYVRSMDKGTKNATISYYKCVRDYMGMLADGFEEERIKSILCVFYLEDVVIRVNSELRDKNEAFKLESMDCYNCADCKWQRDFCMHPDIKKIHMRLKDMYKESKIDQYEIMNLFDNGSEGAGQVG